MRQPFLPLPEPLPALLAEALHRTDGEPEVVSWSHLDEARLRVVLGTTIRSTRGWNLAYCALGDKTVLLARLLPQRLELAPVGDLRGEAVRNLGDALLEGLEEGCARFLLDFSRVRDMGSPALGVLLSFKRTLIKEGRLQDLELRPEPSAACRVQASEVTFAPQSCAVSLREVLSCF